jgi:hypothetical protein
VFVCEVEEGGKFSIELHPELSTFRHEPDLFDELTGAFGSLEARYASTTAEQNLGASPVAAHGFQADDAANLRAASDSLGVSIALNSGTPFATEYYAIRDS